MTAADRQLIQWYREQPYRSGAYDIAIGFLMATAIGRTFTTKLERECKATLNCMRAERARSLSR